MLHASRVCVPSVVRACFSVVSDMLYVHVSVLCRAWCTCMCQCCVGHVVRACFNVVSDMLYVHVSVLCRAYGCTCMFQCCVGHVVRACFSVVSDMLYVHVSVLCRACCTCLSLVGSECCTCLSVIVSGMLYMSRCCLLACCVSPMSLHICRNPVKWHQSIAYSYINNYVCGIVKLICICSIARNSC